MNPVLKRTLAFVALGFMAVFSVCFILYLFDGEMMGGAIEFVVYATGGIGVALSLVLFVINNRELRAIGAVQAEEQAQEAEQAQAEDAQQAEDTQNSNQEQAEDAQNSEQAQADDAQQAGDDAPPEQSSAAEAD